uniref:Testis-specific Y-encoded protein n=1 Tax=Tokudaia muenninki TaxID=742503 RepID=A0A1Q2TRK0_9MURI|nr:testis-specific Y-encoded protein [Tokudaia muenninki]
MESPEEGSVGVPAQEFQDLGILESSLLEGGTPIQAPEQSPGAGDNQMVKPLVIGGPVEDWIPLPEVLLHPDTCEEGHVAAVGELKVTEVADVKNEGEEIKQHRQDGEDQQPALEKDPEQACDSKDQHGIQRLPQSRGGTAESRSKMEELELLQLELSFVNACYSGALAQIKTKVAKMRKPHFERRKTIIEGIPGFWAKAMMNHPQMSSIISNQDEDLLSYMLSLEVAEYNPGPRMCRMMFFFRENPYFRNDIVIKDYQLSIIGYKESDSSTIEWIGQAVHGCANCMQDTTRLTFFNWLCAHKFPGSNKIAEIIMDDLWPNPVYYYPKEDHS